MHSNAKIYIAGHTGLVGSALLRCLNAAGYHNLITRSSNQLDLRNQAAVDDFFARERPEYVFLAAAKVGGIQANASFPADFLYDNLMIATNVTHAAYRYHVKKMLNLGSSCIYPKDAPQPLKEEYLLTGLLEPTNEPYALAKIAAIKLCASYVRQYGCNFISVMPTNLYGFDDTFDREHGHVLPAVMRKIHDAHRHGDTEVVLWGTGQPLREFLHADDLAQALLMLMQRCDAAQLGECINIGSGEEITIKDLAKMIAGIIGFGGYITFDQNYPDGTMRKLLDSSSIRSLGWQPDTTLHEGIKAIYQAHARYW